MMVRMKELEDENRRLRKMYAKERLKAAMVQLACAAFGISQTCYPCSARLDAKNVEIADWRVRLTNNQRNWGFGLCFLYLRNVKRLRLITNASIASTGSWNLVYASNPKSG